MVSSIVFFCQGLSLNLISSLYQARKLKLIEVHTPSPLWTIYAQRTIGLDSDVLRDLVPFAQFKKHEKHPWRSVTFSEIAGRCQKVTLLHGYCLRFFKFCRWYQIAQSVWHFLCKQFTEGGVSSCSVFRLKRLWVSKKENMQHSRVTL